jgi:serine/threonine protein kinase
MGDLFVVEHRELGRTFVAKVLQKEFRDDAVLLDRFRLEAQALGRLEHPHIVSVVNFGTTNDGRPYILLEHLTGRSLAAELKERGRLPVREALHFTGQILSALKAAHAIGVVHRDIKPPNLFLCDAADGARVLKVLDFGVARVLPEAPEGAPMPLSVPTGTGAVIGTPRFVSPEGASGRRVDERADIYGVALVLYAMLAGRGPFDHLRGRKKLLNAHEREEPEPPSSYAEDPIPTELDRAVLKALAKNPEERFQTAAEFRRALEGFAELLGRPAGWLETTLYTRQNLALPEVNAGEATSEQGFALPDRSGPSTNRSRTRSSDEASGVAVATSGSASGLTSRFKPKHRAVILIFLFVLGGFVAAAAAAGLIAILRKGF